MTGKLPEIATVLITVDLGCCCCSKKIKRTLCKLQKRFKINSIVFDEKKKTVTVSGPFNPDCFIKKICCMAYKVIIRIEIITIPLPPPPPPPPAKVEVDVKVEVEVAVTFPTCSCCHDGCSRCCSCGHQQPSQPVYYGGYPCYKIVCEDESYGCSVM